MLWLGLLIVLILLPATIGEFFQHWRIEKEYWKNPDKYGKQNETRKRQREYWKHH